MKLTLFCLFVFVAATQMPLAAIEPAARMLVPAVALMATGIFPCMTLTVNSLKADQRSPALINELYDQLHSLLKVMAASFAVAIVSILLLVAMGAMASVLTAPKFVPYEWAILAVKALAGLNGVLLIVLAGRAWAIGRAFFAILDVNKKQALLAARATLMAKRGAAIEDGKLAEAGSYGGSKPLIDALQ